MILIMIFYILCPFDLIPEALFGIFGLLDDFLVICVLLVIFSNLYYQYVSRRDSMNYNNRN